MTIFSTNEMLKTKAKESVAAFAQKDAEFLDQLEHLHEKVQDLEMKVPTPDPVVDPNSPLIDTMTNMIAGRAATMRWRIRVVAYLVRRSSRLGNRRRVMDVITSPTRSIAARPALTSARIATTGRARARATSTQIT